MCGPRDSVIGVRSEIILRRFLTELPAQFEVADGDVRINAVVVIAAGRPGDRHRAARAALLITGRTAAAGAAPRWPASAVRLKRRHLAHR